MTIRLRSSHYHFNCQASPLMAHQTIGILVTVLYSEIDRLFRLIRTITTRTFYGLIAVWSVTFITLNFIGSLDSMERDLYQILSSITVHISISSYYLFTYSYCYSLLLLLFVNKFILQLSIISVVRNTIIEWDQIGRSQTYKYTPPKLCINLKK